MNHTIAILAIFATQLVVCDVRALEKIIPSTEMQGKLEQMFVANGDADWKTKEPLIDAFALEFTNATSDKRHFVLEQLIYFSAHEDAFETNEGTPFAIGHLILKASISNDEMLTAAIEHWIDADAKLRKAIDTWVQSTTKSDVNSFDGFLPYLEKNRHDNGEPSENAVAYMFERSPERAMLTLERLFGADDEAIERLREEVKLLPKLRFGKYSTKDSEKNKTEQKDLLKRLTVDERWWIRYYAFVIAASAGEVAPEDFATDMKKDPHDFVRNAASRILKSENAKISIE